MSALERPPAFGAEGFVLRPRGKGHKLVRQVFTEDGFTHAWHEDRKDYVSWPGSWKDVETLGTFDTVEQARQFMVDRTREAA